jgi:serine/threonine-protein kinase
MRDLTGVTLGDFEIERRLGRGGMGEVYLARQISLNRPVALKVLRPDLAAKPTYLTRFESEATAVAKLNNPNIVHVYTLGFVDPIRFIAMEYVQGTNLRDYMTKKGPLELLLALSIMKQAAQAIGAAAEHGLVHRDIKPENLLLTRKGQVKVADFGLCRDLDAGSDTHLTQTGVTMGTPLYMSPEQAQGHPLDHRSDLYSLGVTFYHMLAGSPPFRAETALALALKHVQDTPIHLSVHRPDLPPELCQMVMKLMAKDPRQRYQSAAEMLHDLAKVKESLHVTSQPIPKPELTALPTQANGNPATTVRAEKVPFLVPLGQFVHRLGRSLAQGLGWGAIVGLVLLGFAAGLLLGWKDRPQDLLSPTAEVPATLPGLWMVPGWSTIPKQAGPAEQYLYAQTAASADDQPAAWLAVPGYFPQERDRDWAFKAYVQLARWFFHSRDVDRLQTLAAEIETWDQGHQAREREKDLVILLRAATEALQEHADNVIALLDRVNLKALVDPALLTLGIEITAQTLEVALRTSESQPAVPELRLRQGELFRKLFPPLFIPTNRGTLGQGKVG